MSTKHSHDKSPIGGEAGVEQQTPRHDRQNMGPGLGSEQHAKNQGREGTRGSGRNGRTEKGDSARSPRK